MREHFILTREVSIGELKDIYPQEGDVDMGSKEIALYTVPFFLPPEFYEELVKNVRR